MTLPALVIDTNIALDLFVFEDPAMAPLRAALAQGQRRWLATPTMRSEMERVLGYPVIARRLVQRCVAPEAVMDRFDAVVTQMDVAPKAPYTCKDADDQKFIDLAVAHKAVLLSKDAAVLCMARRLARLGVEVAQQWPGGPPDSRLERASA